MTQNQNIFFLCAPDAGQAKGLDSGDPVCKGLLRVAEGLEVDKGACRGGWQKSLQRVLLGFSENWVSELACGPFAVW